METDDRQGFGATTRRRACCMGAIIATQGRVAVHLEIVWDDANLEHATQRATATEISEAIDDAPHYARGRTHGSDRAVIVGRTLGGRRLVVVVHLRDAVTVRPITAWEEERR